MPSACSSKIELDRLRRQQAHAVDLAAVGDSTDWMRATERALPWPLAAAISAWRHSAVHDAAASGDRAGERLDHRRSSGSSAAKSIGSGGGGITLRDAVELARVEADVEVGAQRPGDLLGEERAERFAR